MFYQFLFINIYNDNNNKKQEIYNYRDKEVYISDIVINIDSKYIFYN